MSPPLRPGWPTAALALLTPVAIAAASALCATALSVEGLLVAPRSLTAPGRGLAASGVGYAIFAVFVLRRARAMLPGARGRARAQLLAVGATGFGLATAALGALPDLLAVLGTAPQVGDLPLSPRDVWLSLPRQLQAALLVVTAIGALSGKIALWSALSCWFLLQPRTRQRLWWALDGALLAALAATLAPLLHGRETVGQQAARLGVSFLLGARLGVRGLPFVLDRVERLSFRSLVAARLLRAKKSGFLAAISFLSILAVTVSSSALTMTLSVMGGFRQDLKRKILGNNAHILIDKDHASFEGWQPMLRTVQETPGVRGVSPYVSGEVMVSSASNLAGAVLRGIDPARIGQVSELPKNIKVGSLEYLSAPEKILELPPDQLQLGPASPPDVRFADEEGDLPPPEGARSFLKDVEALLDDIEARRAAKGEDAQAAGADEGEPGDQPTPEPDEQNADAQRAETALALGKPPPGADALPGIIVGQELARSLRLYLGDEVNVVSPLGDLGPAGPMPKARGFRVAGIFYSGMYEYDMKYVYVTLRTAQRFLSVGSAISGIEVTVDEPERADEVARRVAATLGRDSLRVRPWQELNKNLFGALALEKLAMFIALGIAILVASFCIVGTLTLMVQEKGREVAVLKALGTRSGAVAQIFVIKGLLIGMFGAVLGLSIGYVACFAAEHFGVHLNPEVYYIDRLPVHIDPTEFATVGVATVLVCVLATLYPARLASRVRPVDGLRYE